MEIGQILNEDLIDLDLQAVTKAEAIQELTELLSQKGNVTNANVFIEDVYKREAEGQTGLGGGIAIPHGKSDVVKATSIAVGRTKYGLEWESLDDKPVHVIILFAVRNIDKTTVHLKLLSQVAVALADDETLAKLLVTNDKAEVIRLLSNRIQ
jgi:PTS system, fructose subfamily, IIA component